MNHFLNPVQKRVARVLTISGCHVNHLWYLNLENRISIIWFELIVFRLKYHNGEQRIRRDVSYTQRQSTYNLCGIQKWPKHFQLFAIQGLKMVYGIWFFNSIVYDFYKFNCIWFFLTHHFRKKAICNTVRRHACR